MHEICIHTIVQFCDNRDLRLLSCTSSEINRRVLNSSLALYCGVFGAKIDQEGLPLPKSRIELFRIVSRNHDVGNKELFPGVFIFACASGFVSFIRQALSRVQSEMLWTLRSTLTSDGHSALSVAAMNGHAIVVTVLLSAGFYMEEVGTDVRSAIWYACKFGFPEVVRVLLDHIPYMGGGPSPLLANTSDPSPPCLELMSERLLLELGGFVTLLQDDPFNQRHLTRCTALVTNLIDCMNAIVVLPASRAVKAMESLIRPVMRHFEIIPFIRSFVTGSSTRNLENPLIKAACTNQHPLIPIILDSGLYLTDDRASKSNKTALFMACSNGCVEAAQLLLSMKASPSALTSTSRNCLHAAVERDNTAIVSLLCSFASAADILQVNSSDLSPLILAENRGRVRMVIDMLRCYKRTVTIHTLDSSVSRLLNKYAKMIESGHRARSAMRTRQLPVHGIVLQ